MTGKITHVPNQPTLCERGNCPDKPNANHYFPGTIWQCDECGKEWVVVQGSQYNETYKTWRELTEDNRDGRDH